MKFLLWALSSTKSIRSICLVWSRVHSIELIYQSTSMDPDRVCQTRVLLSGNRWYFSQGFVSIIVGSYNHISYSSQNYRLPYLYTKKSKKVLKSRKKNAVIHVFSRLAITNPLTWIFKKVDKKNSLCVPFCPCFFLSTDHEIYHKNSLR
jgi:hypothetical protein